MIKLSHGAKILFLWIVSALIQVVSSACLESIKETNIFTLCEEVNLACFLTSVTWNKADCCQSCRNTFLCSLCFSCRRKQQLLSSHQSSCSKAARQNIQDVLLFPTFSNVRAVAADSFHVKNFRWFFFNLDIWSSKHVRAASLKSCTHQAYNTACAESHGELNW